MQNQRPQPHVRSIGIEPTEGTHRLEYCDISIFPGLISGRWALEVGVGGHTLLGFNNSTPNQLSYVPARESTNAFLAQLVGCWVIETKHTLSAPFGNVTKI